MPRRTDISSILIIGAGPIVIGQAAEFDYSGTQAAKTLKAEGYRIVLVNSNPATIMTDPELADATYIEPITPEFVAASSRRSGRTRCFRRWGADGAQHGAGPLQGRTLEKFGVQMIGADAVAIEKAEDRLKFRDAMSKIGLESPRSQIAHSLKTRCRRLRLQGFRRSSAPASRSAARAVALLTSRGVFGDRHRRTRSLADHRKC
jgi:carbamoyl-phosphate synthase large subunit